MTVQSSIVQFENVEMTRYYQKTRIDGDTYVKLSWMAKTVRSYVQT